MRPLSTSVCGLKLRGRVSSILGLESQMLCFCFLGTGICFPPPISLLSLSVKAACMHVTVDDDIPHYACMSMSGYEYARIMLSLSAWIFMLVYV